MALRVMQIYLPADADNKPGELLEGREILGRWHDHDDDKAVWHVLVPAEETEPIMDRFEQHYADVEGFHVVLFPVEAVLPRPKELEEEPPEEEQENNNRSRVSREELYADVLDSCELSRVFLGLAFLSALVAAIGLIRDDVAVIIGAMVIAPLLGPNVAVALATTLGDLGLLRRAVLTNFAGVGVAFLAAIVIGLTFPFDPDVAAIAARTNIGVGDVILALAAGMAGTLAFTRGQVGAVIGVMVAVALVPPLVVCGMLLGAGYTGLAFKAGLLTAANVICVNLAGVVTFLLQGVRPRSWWEAEAARKGVIIATLIWTILLAGLLLILSLGLGPKV